MDTSTWTAERFAYVDWPNFVAAATKPECWAYAQIAREKRDEASDAPTQEAWDFLTNLMWLQLVESDSETSPLGPEQLFDAIPREALQALVGCLSMIADPELTARIADAAWLKERACGHEVARDGVQAYLDSAKRLHDPEHWSDGYQRIRRAVELAASLGKRDNPTFDNALAEVERVIESVGDTDPLYLCARLSTLLLIYRRGDPPKQAALLGAIADRAEAKGDLDRARTLLDLKADWHRRGKQPEEARATKLHVAALFERDADSFIAANEAIQAAGLLTQAVEAYRQFDGQGEKVEELRVKLQQVQRKLPESFAHEERSVDLNDCVVQSKARVSGKPPLNALVALAGLRGPPDLGKLRSLAEARLRDSVFYALVRKTKVSGAGRVVHAQEGALEDPGGALLTELHTSLTVQHEVFAQGGVRPAVDQIQLEHGLRAADLMYLTSRSPFVPAGREVAFARGLAAGLQGEFDVAAHLLMPQFENALRVLLERHGAVTTTLPSTGQQNELDLNALLHTEAATKLLGAEEVFDLKSLLTEKAGTNLRNELAHGLIDDYQGAALYAYFWWVVLRYVLIPLVEQFQSAPSSRSEAIEPQAEAIDTDTEIPESTP